ncbi:MAG: ABC transporter ATP-binding protein, partial [Clostridia bacterium]|nr:ABC transporter ATP-binding protein [Clostridia bacterium]
PIRRHLPGLALLTVCDGLLSLCAVGFAYLSRSFLDEAIAGGLRAAAGSAAAMVAVVAAQLVMHVLSSMLTEGLTGRISMTLRSGMLEHVLHKTASAMHPLHPGEVQSRIFSDTAVVAGGVVGILPAAVAIFTRLAAVFAVLIMFDQYLVAAFAAMGLVLYLASRLVRTRLKKLHTAVQQADDRQKGGFLEALERFVIIKAYSREQTALEGARDRQKGYFRARMAKARLNTAVSSGFLLFFRGAYLGVMIYCAFRLASGDQAMTFGTLTALLQLVSQVQQPFASLSGIMPRYYAMTASAERLARLCEDTETVTPRDCAKIYDRMTAIELRNVTFGYGDTHVLQNASATVQKGSLTLLSGQTGAGKTTLLTLLMGFYDHSGEIVTDCGDLLDGGTREMFGYMPQGNMLFSGTVAENICFGEPIDEARLQQALKISLCDEFVSNLPQGKHTHIGQEGSALSEGQAQRINLARAIYSGARVLLLDEPTSALDAHTEEQVLRNLSNLTDHTIIMISHKSAAQEFCTHHLHLQDGRLTQA